MRISLVIFIFFFFTSCRTDLPIRVSQKSEVYTRSFHEALRNKMSGNYEKALVLFNKCLKEVPNDDASHYAIAQIELIRGNIDIAKEHTILAFEMDKRNIYYQIELGYMFKETGQYEKAALVFEKIIQKAPEMSNYYFEAAHCWELDQNIVRAIQVMNDLESLTGKNIEATLKKHAWYKKDKQLKEAEKELVHYMENDNNNAFVTATLVDFYLSNGEVNKGIEQLKKLVEIDPSNGKGLLLLAEFEYENKDLKTATDYYSRALFTQKLVSEEAIEALNFFIYHNIPSTEHILDETSRVYENDTIQLFIGDYYLKSKKHKKAKKSLEKAIENNPGTYVNWERLLYLFYEIQDWEYLVENGANAIKTFPLKTMSYYMTSLALNQIKKYNEAIEIAEQGLFTVMNDPVLESDLYGQLGESYFGKELFLEAKKHYLKAIRLSEGSQNDYLQFNFCLRLFEHNIDLTLSLELLSELIEKNGTNFEYTLLKGDVLFLKGDFKNALETYKLLLSENYVVEEATIRERIGDAFAMLNNMEEALIYWKTALSLVGGSEKLEKKIINESYFD